MSMVCAILLPIMLYSSNVSLSSYHFIIHICNVINLTIFFVDKPTSVTLNVTDGSQVPVNSTLTFSCLANARPIASYVFYRNGIMVQNSSSNIWNTQILPCPSASGREIFQCTAYNMVGNTLKTVSIIVVGKCKHI